MFGLACGGSGEEAVPHDGEHTHPVAALAARGTQLVSASDDRSAKVWTLPDLTGVRTLPQESYATAAAISPDGSRIAVGTIEGFEVWDTKTWRRVHTLPEAPVAIAWEGAILALAPSGSSDIILLDGTSFAERGRLKGHHESVQALAMTGDGANLLSGSKDRTARMWDTGATQQLQVYVGHRSPVLAVAFGPTGAIATGSSDKTAMIWHAVSGEPIRRFAGHRDWVTGVGFDPEGRDLLVTAGRDGAVRTWDATDGEALAVVDPENGPLESMVFGGVGVVIAGDGLRTLAVPPAEGRRTLEVNEPKIDRRCAPILSCAIAAFDSKQLDPKTTWSVVSRARELSAADPRSCSDLRTDLEAIEGTAPAACALPE